MVFVTAVRMAGGNGHEHIASVRWRNPDSGKTDQSRREQMVAFINKNGAETVKVTDGIATVSVGVFREKWLRTHADGKWTDNLLALPRY